MDAFNPSETFFIRGVLLRDLIGSGFSRRFARGRGRDGGGLGLPSKQSDIINNPLRESLERLPADKVPLLLTGLLVSVVQDLKTPRHFTGQQDSRLIPPGAALILQLFQRFDCMGHLGCSVTRACYILAHPGALFSVRLFPPEPSRDVRLAK